MSSIVARSSSAALRSRRLPRRRSCARCAGNWRGGGPMSPLKVKTPSLLLVLAVLLVTVGVARGGHELPVYPSYYPHEIAIATTTPERAPDLLRDATLQAYLGAEPHFPSPAP